MKYTIEVTENESKKTFTIRKKYADGSTVKYRTLPVETGEFNDMYYNTQVDWDHFLECYSGSYYPVKRITSK